MKRALVLGLGLAAFALLAALELRDEVDPSALEVVAELAEPLLLLAIVCCAVFGLQAWGRGD